MAKGEQQKASTAAGNLQKSSTTTTTGNIFGGEGGAFGEGGLSLGYRAPLQKALTGYDTNYETGGYDPTALKQMRDTSSNYAITGGVDPAAIARYTKLAQEGPDISTEATGALKGLVSGGGLSPESAAFYRENIGTGGYSDADKQGVLRQATSGVKGSFGVLSDQARRAAAASGGLGTPGAVSSLGRGALQTQAETTTNALNDVNAQIRANRFKAAAGLDEGTKNVLAATSGLTEQDRLRLQGQTTGAQGLTDQAGLKLKGLAQQQGIESDVSRNKLGYDQMMQVMSSDAGKMILNMLGIDSNNQQAAMKTFADLSKNPGVFDNILRTITAIKGGTYSFPGGGGAPPGSTSGGGVYDSSGGYIGE